MRNHLLILVFINFINNLNAQFSDTKQYYLGYSCTGNYNNTNENKGFLLNNSLEIKHNSQNILYNLNVKQLFGKQGEKQVNNDITTLFDINKFILVPGFYYWGLASYSKIYSLNVNHQLQSGGGLAYNIINKKRLKLNLSEGILYDFSELQQNDTLRDIYSTLRNSFRVQLKFFIKDLLTFRSAFYVQNSIEYKNDVILKNENELIFHIKGILNGSVRMQYNKMTRTRRESLLITWGLVLNKYF